MFSVINYSINIYSYSKQPREQGRGLVRRKGGSGGDFIALHNSLTGECGEMGLVSDPK